MTWLLIYLIFSILLTLGFIAYEYDLYSIEIVLLVFFSPFMMSYTFIIGPLYKKILLKIKKQK